MNVFLVDAGKLFSLDAGIVSKRVCDLQSALSDLADIPIDKQVLLTHDGRSLDTSAQLYTYGTSFSTDNPLFLFSKSSIECNVVPPNTTLPQDPSLQDRLDRYLADTQSCEALKFGADLAHDYQKYADNILSRTRQLVQDQQYQRDGWASVINNLDQVTAGFNKRVATFEELYNSFITNKDKYSTMLVQFETDVKLLSQIPLTNGITGQLQDNKLIESIRYSKQQGLGITESMRAPDPMQGSSPLEPEQQVLKLYNKSSDFISLLDWVEAQDSQNSLNSLVIQCSRAMEQVNQVFLPRVLEEVDKVTQSLQAPGMRDIKGLEERLTQLSSLLQHMVKICEEQSNNANTIKNQQESFMVQGDISVLSDLLDMHKDQLKRLHSNNRSLIEYYNKFAIAKGELSQNLLIRLNWVTHCQKTIWNCDGRLTMLAENLMRVRRRFQILEQINIAPDLYCKCLGEVYRRGSFTKKYKSWGQSMLDKVDEERNKECEKRIKFQDNVQGHFLTTLFRGLDSLPPQFASEDALNFDAELFDVSNEELAQVADLLPNFTEPILPHASTDTGPMDEAPDIPDVPCKAEVTTPIADNGPELKIQLDKNVRLEQNVNRLEVHNSTLDDINRELEEKVIISDNNLKMVNVTVDCLNTKLDDIQRECKTFQCIACEKDTKYNSLKVEFDTNKLELRGANMDKTKLHTQITDLQTQLKQNTKFITDKEEKIKNLERELEIVNSDQTANEQHRQQLNNLKSEIEREKDKEKEFELEKLRLDKDKIIHELETIAKLQHGELEKIRQDQLQEISDENSKLQARIVALQADLEKEQETTLMSRFESERDLKLLQTNTAVEVEDLRKTAGVRESKLLDTMKLLQSQVTSLQSQRNEDPVPSTSTTSSLSGGPSSLSGGPSIQRVTELETLLRKKEEDLTTLQALKDRSITLTVTQFQKGDTVLFYYDADKSNYLVANISPNEYQYFLHPDNLAALGLSLPGPDTPPHRAWCIGVIKEKEFCQARKVNNRFKVPEGRKFYRVYAQPRTHSSSRSGTTRPGSSAGT